MKQVTQQHQEPTPHQPMPDVPLRDPAYLRGVAAGIPLVLTVMSLLAVYFRPAVAFSLLTVPPLIVWSCWLYVWAGRRKLSGDAKTDRHLRLDVTLKSFMFLQVAGVVASVLCLDIALGALTLLVAIVSATGLAAIAACYLVAFCLSFLLPNWFMQAEVDAVETRPKTRAGKALKNLSRIPTEPGPIAGFGIAVVTILRVLGSDSWVAGVAGALGLFCAFASIMVISTGFRKWQYLRRLREPEFGGKD
jgi:hypothetical protein